MTTVSHSCTRTCTGTAFDEAKSAVASQPITVSMTKFSDSGSSADAASLSTRSLLKHIEDSHAHKRVFYLLSRKNSALKQIGLKYGPFGDNIHDYSE